MSTRPPLYKRRSIQVGAVIIAIPVLALAWYLGSPLLFDTVVDEPFPRAAAAEVPDDMTEEEVEAEMLEAEAVNTDAADDMPETEPVLLATGSLMGADSFHQGSGDVSVFELADGSRILRLEEIDVTNGPDLHVIITPVTGVEGRDDVKAPGYLDLGELRGNVGSLNYDLPADYELPEEFTVVIYCVPFHVLFATAELG